MSGLSKEQALNQVSWRKRKRITLLKCSFGLLIIGFVFSYVGATNNMPAGIAAANIIMIIACVLPIIVKK